MCYIDREGGWKLRGWKDCGEACTEGRNLVSSSSLRPNEQIASGEMHGRPKFFEKNARTGSVELKNWRVWHVWSFSNTSTF
jgi:hypothetical protein